MLSAWGLTKAYDGRRVVDQVGFELQPGTVTAFLGPNGAGKSTTLRMISGLTVPDAGQSLVAGRPFTQWPNPSYVAGVLLDGQAVHPGRSGLTHLRTSAMLSGVPKHRCDEVLQMVGLADAAKRKIGKYSLGMRQRLGLAHALLTNPPVLILDEPINGLDPEGIRSVRTLLRDYAARGGTVLLSSHVLSEVDQTADRVLMIGGGRILRDGPLAELTKSNRTLVKAADMNRLAQALTENQLQPMQGPDGHIAVNATLQQVSELAMKSGIAVLSLKEDQMSLEDLFFQVTGNGGQA
ncbi:ATP-binding cassette domain-containing protein [Allokutzneria sp. NRRL B-24872]|uniref:ATP-binding cassette domain-containing protein n=1 Tax=Allokutzneria sp. NRRL B-24872 TaxID=1137961 RepID=UPI000A379B64|nr:ATP-binding cassette domain-containing protein [Allokutzneria sp. NRRL B-24872]